MPQPDRSRLFDYAVVALLTVTAVLIGRSRYFILTTSLTAFPWLALLGCTIVQLRYRFRPLDLALTLAFAGACVLLRWQILNLPWHYLYKVLGGLIGLGSLLLLASRAVWERAGARIGYLSALVPSILLVGSEWLTPPLLNWAQVRNPKTMDIYLLVFDSTLRFQPAFAMGRVFQSLPALRSISIMFYLGLPLLIALVYVEQLRRNRNTALVTFLIFFFAAIIGASAYNLYPACGPISLLGDQFPHLHLSLRQAAELRLEPVPISAPRNAMPSMHMAWVLLAVWLSRNLGRWVKLIGLLYFLFTLTATLGTGEHYFIDLVVAFPFSLALYALFALDVPIGRQQRLYSLIGGALATAVWLALLRWQIPLFVHAPGLSWLLILATVIPVVFAQRKLSALRMDQPAALEAMPSSSGTHMAAAETR
jgi:hypothetical protein